MAEVESSSLPDIRRSHSPGLLRLPQALWWAVVLRDVALIGIGIDAYYGHPLAAAYPFSWFLERAQMAGADSLRGVTSLLALGSTPAAAALLLGDSIVRLRPAEPPQGYRLLTGAFSTVVGAGFLITLLIYVLRAPWVLDWGKESVAAAVHVSILAHGLWVIRCSGEALPRFKLGSALALSVLWVALVTLPQHPWLVVWQHTWRDWTTGDLPFK